MAVNTPAATAPATGHPRRLAGPDVVRAFALIGVVVMNYHGYLIIGGAARGTGSVDRFFDPWNGPMSTRFAATFVLVAGVGVTLLTRSSLTSPERITEMRWRLVRRGAILYVGGVLLDTIWAGTIIPYYGAMFALAALLFTASGPFVVATGLIAAIAGASMKVWQFWQNEDGNSTAWLVSPADDSVADFVFGVAVNGTHPLLPWLLYFCVGIVLGRVLDTDWWRRAALGGGLGLFAAAALVSSTAATPFERLVLSTDPSSRGLVYVASALGTALVAFTAIDWLANRFPTATDPFRRAGQMSLSLYLAHIVVFNFVVDWMGWVEPAGLGTSLTFALAFWVVGITAGTLWHRRFGRGPAERIYRAIGG